jgi:hypothetical protein
MSDPKKIERKIKKEAKTKAQEMQIRDKIKLQHDTFKLLSISEKGG